MANGADPRILLNPQVANVGQTFGNALLNVQRLQGLRQAEQQADLQQQLQPLRSRLLEAQVAGAEAGVPTSQQQFDAAEIARAKSIAIGARQLKPFLDSGDISGARASLDRRIASLDEAGVSSVDSREARDLLESSPGDLAFSTDQAIELGTELGAFGTTTPTGQKGRTVLVRQPDGALAFSTNIIDPSKGTAETVTTPVGGQLISALGETAGQQQIRQVTTEVKKAAGKAGVKLETEPAIQAAVTNAVAEVKAQFKISGEERSNAKTFESYNIAMKGLVDSLAGTDTGPFGGLIPSVTANQQIVEGAIAAMAPMLKDIFRASGEGTFTKDDQEILLAMLPTRKDRPKARAAKISNVDAIIRSKLGQPEGPPPGVTPPPAAPGQAAVPASGTAATQQPTDRFLGFE